MIQHAVLLPLHPSYALKYIIENILLQIIRLVCA